MRIYYLIFARKLRDPAESGRAMTFEKVITTAAITDADCRLE